MFRKVAFVACVSIGFATPAVSKDDAFDFIKIACLSPELSLPSKVQYFEANGYSRFGLNKNKSLFKKNGKPANGRHKMVGGNRNSALEIGHINGGRKECYLSFPATRTFEGLVAEINKLIAQSTGQNPTIKKLSKNNFRFDYPGGRMFADQVTRSSGSVVTRVSGFSR